MESAVSAAILVVDDRSEQRLALSVVLGELGEVVEAASGREALRWLLRREFAVILLDVNMPSMDGLETASLIRQRPSSEDTPIIFITAGGDEAHALRGYSLGAVDYILTPVDPTILRTKVSVFLDLFRKREEVRWQAEQMRRHAGQLSRLTAAAIGIHGARSLDDLLKVVADAAVSVVGAGQVAVEVDAPALVEPGHAPAAVSGKRSLRRPEESALEALGRAALGHGAQRPVRMTSRQLEGSPHWALLGGPPRVPLRGWLAVPLSSREGRLLGWIQLSGRHSGDFTAEDESALVQLAQMASIAAENTLLKGVREASQLKDQFLATLSHELRTPLQAILTWSHMLREAPRDGALLQRGLEVVERNARTQARLIEDLLDVSRILRGRLLLERRPLRLAEVIEGATEDMAPAAGEKRIAIQKELLGGPGDLGRRAAPAPGARQPALERDQVHAGGGLRHGAARDERGSGPDLGARHRHRHRARISPAAL
jgi:CheY-like chemotaxis protein